MISTTNAPSAGSGENQYCQYIYKWLPLPTNPTIAVPKTHIVLIFLSLVRPVDSSLWDLFCQYLLSAVSGMTANRQIEGSSRQPLWAAHCYRPIVSSIPLQRDSFTRPRAWVIGSLEPFVDCQRLGLHGLYSGLVHLTGTERDTRLVILWNCGLMLHWNRKWKPSK